MREIRGERSLEIYRVDMSIPHLVETCLDKRLDLKDIGFDVLLERFYTFALLSPLHPTVPSSICRGEGDRVNDGPYFVCRTRRSLDRVYWGHVAGPISEHAPHTDRGHHIACVEFEARDICCHRDMRLCGRKVGVTF